jgi:hypothetical protein
MLRGKKCRKAASHINHCDVGVTRGHVESTVVFTPDIKHLNICISFCINRLKEYCNNPDTNTRCW